MEVSLVVFCFCVGYIIIIDKLDVFYKQVKFKGVIMMVLLVKVVVVILVWYFQVNVVIIVVGMVYLVDVNVVVVVVMEDGGLIMLVLCNVDCIDFYEMLCQWGDLVKCFCSKQLQFEEYFMGIFIFFNFGMFGVDCFDVIFFLGIGVIFVVVVLCFMVVVNKDGFIVVKCQMQVNLMVDYWVIYGVDGVVFLKDFVDLIENCLESLVF